MSAFVLRHEKKQGHNSCVWEITLCWPSSNHSCMPEALHSASPSVHLSASLCQSPSFIADVCLSESSLYLVLLLPVCLLWYFNRTDSHRNQMSRTSNWAFNRLSDVCLLLDQTEKHRVTLQTARHCQLDSLGKVIQHFCNDVLFVNNAH